MDDPTGIIPRICGPDRPRRRPARRASDTEPAPADRTIPFGVDDDGNRVDLAVPDPDPFFERGPGAGSGKSTVLPA
jgi:hypothetical protein